MYLGAKLCKTRSRNGVYAWAMNPVTDVQEAVRNCTVHILANYGDRFRGHDPEWDTSSELDQDAASYYLTFINILR